MGDERIGCFAKGPRKLPERAAAAAVSEAERRLDWLRRAWAALAAADHRPLYELLKTCPWADPERPLPPLRRVDFEMTGYRLGDLIAKAGNVGATTGRAAVEEFRANWPPQSCDAACLADPDIPGKLIVFAGQHTPGDTPDGAGLRLLTRAGVLGIAPTFGVWVEAAFVTLHIPSNPKGTRHDATD